MPCQNHTVQDQGTNVTVTLPFTHVLLCECACVCAAMWVLKWITVVPLATSAKPFPNIFKLSTTKGF